MSLKVLKILFVYLSKSICHVFDYILASHYVSRISLIIFNSLIPKNLEMQFFLYFYLYIFVTAYLCNDSESCVLILLLKWENWMFRRKNTSSKQSYRSYAIDRRDKKKTSPSHTTERLRR